MLNQVILLKRQSATTGMRATNPCTFNQGYINFYNFVNLHLSEIFGAGIFSFFLFQNKYRTLTFRVLFACIICLPLKHKFSLDKTPKLLFCKYQKQDKD